MQAWLVSEHSSRGLDPETLSGIFANAQVPQGPRSGKTFGKKNLIAFRKGLPKRPLSLSLQPADHSHPRLDSRFCRPLSLSLSLSLGGGARPPRVSALPRKDRQLGRWESVEGPFFLFPFSFSRPATRSWRSSPASWAIGRRHSRSHRRRECVAPE